MLRGEEPWAGRAGRPRGPRRRARPGVSRFLSWPTRRPARVDAVAHELLAHLVLGRLPARSGRRVGRGGCRGPLDQHRPLSGAAGRAIQPVKRGRWNERARRCGRAPRRPPAGARAPSPASPRSLPVAGAADVTWRALSSGSARAWAALSLGPRPPRRSA